MSLTASFLVSVCSTLCSGLAASELPQPRINLMDIASTPSVCSSNMGSSKVLEKTRVASRSRRLFFLAIFHPFDRYGRQRKSGGGHTKSSRREGLLGKDMLEGRVILRCTCMYWYVLGYPKISLYVLGYSWMYWDILEYLEYILVYPRISQYIQLPRDFPGDFHWDFTSPGYPILH